MPRIVCIGGSGHIGSYLIPRLVERGHEVINVSRGAAKPYVPHPCWKRVKQETVDRIAEEKEGKFAARIAALDADVVVDLIAFEFEQVQGLVEALAGKIGLYIFCSSVWVYGHSISVPTIESDPTNPIGDYGKAKCKIEQYLMRKAKVEGFPATSFRPGHIVGQGWKPLNPQGNFDAAVFETIANHQTLTLPDHGLATVHHVHADDLALWVMCAIDHTSAAIGECFNVVSSQALTLRGYTEAMYRWFGHDQPNIEYMPLKDWQATVSKERFDASWEHIRHSPCSSIEKSRTRLGFEPRYTSLEAVQQSVQELIKSGQIKVPQATG